jgi:hypothetical protein
MYARKIYISTVECLTFHNLVDNFQMIDNNLLENRERRTSLENDENCRIVPSPSKISRNLDAFQVSRIEDLAFKKTSGCQTLTCRDTR